MPLNSRIVAPALDDDRFLSHSDYHNNRPRSPSPARMNSRSSFGDKPYTRRRSDSSSEDDPNTRRRSDPSFEDDLNTRRRSDPSFEDDPNTRRRSGSGSVYNYGSRAISSAHDNHRYGTSIPRQHSHISVSSNDTDADPTELLLLRNKNTELKLELAHLRGKFEALADSYNTLLDGIGEKVTDTRNDVKHLVDRISAGAMFGANATSVSLNPRQEDHSGSQFWKRSYWAAYRNGSRINDTDMAALSLFMEDGAGNPIPEEAKNDLRDAVYGFWREMIEKKEKPTVYKDASYRTREDFRVTMEGKFPWLRLCDGHWKVKQVWKNCFATWKKSNMPDEASPATKTRTMKAIHTAPTDQDNPEAKTIIEIVSSDDNSSAGSKRRREDNSDAVSSKKHKGKGPANIHPAQSRPKKLKGKAINEVDPFANIRITTDIVSPVAAQAQVTPMASGSGTIHSSPPLPSHQITASVNISDARNKLAASGSGTVRSPPPPSLPQVAALDPQTLRDTPGATFTVPYTQIMSIPNTLSASPTPELPTAHTGTHPPQIVPATPDISSNENDSNDLDRNSSTSGGNSTTTSSSSEKLIGPSAKKAKGRFPYKKFAREAWVKEGGNDTKFESYWKKLGDEEKKAKIEEITRANK